MTTYSVPRNATSVESVGRSAPPRHGQVQALRSFPAAVLITLLLMIELIPLVWLVIGSFKTQDEFLNAAPWALPKSWNFDNYATAFADGNIGQNILNSSIAVFPSLIIAILFGTAAGFALEVMVWKGRNGVLLAFLAGIMIPFQMLLLPLFSMYFGVGVTGTLWPLIITYVGGSMPLTVFMMATFFRAIPREIFEASTLDGANIFRSFWLIGLPMVRNAIVTVALVQFFFMWNDLLIAITFANTPDLQTIQVGLLNFQGRFGVIEYGPTLAAICINVFGILILYTFLNQQVMKGLAAGSVKG